MKRHRGYAIFLALLILALVLVTIVLSSITYFKGRSDANVKVLGIRQQFGAIYGDRLVVAFDADSLSVADGTLKGNLSLTLPEGIRKRLVDFKTRQPIYTDCSNFCALARDKDTKLQLIVTAFDASGKPSAEIVKSFTLNDISQGFTDRVVEPVVIPLTAFQSNYPDDTYKTGIYIDYGIPGTLDTNDSKPLKVDYEFSGGTVGKNFDVTVRQNNEIKGFGDRNFIVSFERSTPTRIYIYLVALVPLILALIFLHLLFFSRHAESKDFEEYAEALIVTILAVLPLRIVLVPPELTNLTRVDLLLGFGLVAIVAIAGFKYATEVWRGRDGEEHVHVAAPEPAAATQPVPAGE